MKKFLALALVVLMGASANAQLVQSRSFHKEGARVNWFVRGGVSLNTTNGKYVKDFKKINEDNGFKGSVGFKPGFDVSAGFQRFFGKKNGYWGAELGVGTRGFTQKSKSESVTYKENLNAFTVKLPIFLGYSYPINEDFRIDGHVGPFVSFDFAGKFTDSDGETTSISELEDEYDNEYQRLDVGAAAGLGVWYDHVLLDVTYQRGFFKWFGAEHYLDQGNASNIIIRLGYAF